MFQRIAVLIIIGVVSSTAVAKAAMSSTNYSIRWDTISTGGSDTSASASYQLHDTVGNAGIGDADSASYQLVAGYRQGIFDQIITFDVLGTTNATERAATASAGTTITTSTAGLSVGDFIVLVQDKGASQVSAVGFIISIGVGTITLDELKDGGVAPVIDGANDFVYRLGSTSASLGTLDSSVVSTSVVGFNVNADVDNGYTVQLFDDGNLRDGAEDINDVADGTVTAGAEEYGGRSSDTTLTGSTFDTADTAFTTTAQNVVEESAGGFERRNFVTLKASISGATDAGSYSHALSFIVSGNY